MYSQALLTVVIAQVVAEVFYCPFCNILSKCVLEPRVVECSIAVNTKHSANFLRTFC